MDDHFPHALGLCRSHESEPPVNNTVPRAKRLLDSPEQVQVLQSAKKACVFSHQCSTPSEKLLLHPSGSACSQGSSYFPDDSGHDDLVASSSESKYNNVATSLGTARYYDDSEPDDSLLELSDSEQGNSPFNYTEEEIQEILADDCLECEQHITRKSTLSQNVSGESEKDVSSSCTGASVISEDAKVASEITEKPNVPLSVQVSGVLFDLDIEELLNFSPIDADYVDQPLDDDFLEEAEIVNEYTVYDQTDASNCFPRESLGWLRPDGQQTLGVDCLGKTSSAGTDVSHFCGDNVGESMPCSDLACGQHKADESAAPELLRSPEPSSGSRNQELSKATTSCFSRKSGSPTDDGERESSEAEQPSDSIKLSDKAVGQIGQEETAGGKKLGRVIPVPQVEERQKQQTNTSEVELEQKKHTQCAHAQMKRSVDPTADALSELHILMNKVVSLEYRTLDQKWQHPSDLTVRNYPRSTKKTTEKYSLTQCVSKNLAKHHHFQSIPDHFQRSPVTVFSNISFCC